MLKKEYQNIVKQDSRVYEWLTEDVLNGIWYCNLNHPKDIYINDAFMKTLKYPESLIKYAPKVFTDTLKPKDRKNIDRLIDSFKSGALDKFNATFKFNNYLEKTIVLKAFGITIYDSSGEIQGLLIKFLQQKNPAASKTTLLKKVAAIEKLKNIYHETNTMARVGGWEINLIKNTVAWTQVTKEIHEVNKNFKPDLTSTINFYKEGYSRDKITKLINDAFENGTSFDTELKIITAKNNEIWVRVFGKPEFEDKKCIGIYGAFQDINEKKKQEDEIKGTNALFEKVFSNSPIGKCIVNRNNKMLMINPSLLKIFGFKKSDKNQVLSLDLKTMLHEEDLEEVNSKQKKLLEGKINKYKTEARFYKKNGEILWCSINSSIVFNQKDSDDIIITQIEDITERKRLEREAQENSNKFINIFEYSPNGMAVVGRNGEWLMVNKSLSSMIGYTKEELLKLNFKTVTHPDDRDIDKLLLKELFSKKRESFSRQKRYLHKNGTIIHCFLNVSLLTNGEGKPVSFVGQIVDLTDTIKTEIKLKKTLGDLQSLLNAATHVSIIETDLNGIVRKFNKGAENLLGFNTEDIVGKLNVCVLHEPKEIALKSKQLYKEYNKEINGFEVFVQKAKLGKHDTGEWTFIRKYGERFTVQLVVTAIKNIKNEITGYLCVATDITALKEMEATLIKSKLKAEAANKSKSEFLANMSHEIRTPLNGVIGFTDLLMKTNLTSVQEKYMLTVFNSANTLLDLLNDILDFSKIEAGKLEINNEKTDLIKLCGQTIDIIKHQAHEKGLEVLLDIDPNSQRFIKTDSIRLRQILTNLLGNAVKFTQQGEIELKIKTKPNPLSENEKLYEFSIRDTGIGIAEKNIKKIFQAFDQEDASTTRKYGGTGLGLTISNKLLELMNSSLKIESVLGSGSTFYFTLNFEIEKQKEYTSNPKAIKNVLIIDDNKNNQSILENMLAIYKINSTSFSNGIDAIEFLEKENPFDLAIIDYHMPYLNGIDLIKYFREKLLLNSKALPIILLHSSGDDKIVQKACRDFDIQFNVIKPIQMNHLYELLSNIKDPLVTKTLAVKKEKLDLSMLSFNILVAEDNPVNKFLSKSIINKMLPLSKVLEASDGIEALKIYKENALDFIFMDIQMPNMSGFEATKEIRKLEKKENRIPIIALTARTVKGEKERCLENDMDGYISKPVIMKTMRKTIIDFLVNTEKRKSNISMKNRETIS